MKHGHFHDKRVWITGASSGIGRALAVELAARGARLALSARNAAALDSLAAELPRERVLVLPLDITRRGANTEAMSEVERRWGGLDIAILNAGNCEYLDVGRFDAGIFERMLTTNVLGMVYGIEAALPLLRHARQPQLVGMSSTAAYAGLPRAAAYGASKAAIRNMLQGLRLDLLPERIAVSIVLPGFVRTPLTDRNDFPMPFRVEADEAARMIADGIAARRHEIDFPKRFSLPFKLLASLPSALYTRLLAGTVRTS